MRIGVSQVRRDSAVGAAGVPSGAAEIEEREVRLLLAESVRYTRSVSSGFECPSYEAT